MKHLYFAIALFIYLPFVHSQCTFTGTPLTQAGSVNTFVIDANANTINVNNVNAGQFVSVNVVKGYNYTFSVGDVFATLNENITILDAVSNTSVTPAAFSGATSGTSVVWTATFSGQIKVLLSKDTCVNDNTTGGTITMVLNSTVNTQDSEAAFGIDSWVGHIYNYAGGASPGGSGPIVPVSTTTQPFIAANYVGYYNVATETINEGFAGGIGFPVLSNGAVRVNISQNSFAVRYKMRSTKTGCYFANFNGDDGLRIYVDGNLIFNEWKDQAPNNYNNVLLYLNGNSEIIFDYYENGGGNNANFSITPFIGGTPNNVAMPNPSAVCSGVATQTINGSSFAYNGGTVNPTIKFQWQLSTDNVTFTDILGATTEDYTPPAVTTTTVAIVNYYRRVVTAASPSASLCTSNSNSVSITTSPGPSSQSGTISGAATTCSGLTGQVYSTTAVSGASSYSWIIPTGWTITAGQGTTSLTVTVGAGGQNGNISVMGIFACGAGAIRNLAVTVNSSSIGGTLSGNQTICSGASLSSNISISNRTGNILKWQKSDTASFVTVTDIATTAQPLTPALAGTFTANTYIRAVVQSGTCVQAFSSSVLVTVIASIAGTVSSNQTICSGNQPTSLTLSGNTGNVVKWQKSTDNTFATFTDIANTTTTLTGAAIGNLTTTSYFRAVVQNSTCAPVNANFVTITVNPLTVAGSLSGNQSTCVGAAPSNNLTLGGNIGNVIKWQKSNDNTFATFTDIANTSTTLTSTEMGILSTTTYFRVVVQSANCAVANSNFITISFANTTWDGTSWDNGIPTITTTAFMTGNFTSTDDLFACSLTVSNNANVVINGNHNVTLNGKLTVDSGSTYTMNNGSNLMQQTDIANTGNINLKKNSSALIRLDYTLWAAPVSGSQTLLNFSPSTLANRFYVYNNITNLFNTTVASTTTFAEAKSYLIRVPNNHPSATATAWTGNFNGVPNNGNKSYALAAGFNAVGNPYPSRLNVVNFIDANTNTDGTLYFWRKTNDFTQTSYATLTKFAYTSNNTLGGDTGTGFFNTGNEANWVVNIGQGFFVNATAAGALNFNNSMRRLSSVNQFFRSANTTNNRSIYWLNLTNNFGAFNQMVVGYTPEATMDIDFGFDGKNITSDFFMTSLINQENYAIQARPEFNSNDVVPVAYKVTTAGNHAISIDHTTGLFDDAQQPIFIKDNATNIYHDLKTGAYEFYSDSGTFNNRIEIVYSNNPVLANDTFVNDKKTIIAYKTNSNININSGKSVIKDVKIFDIRGRLLIQKNNIQNNTFAIESAVFGNQILLVKTTTNDGVVATHKIVN